MKAVFGEKVVEVVSGDAARNVGKLAAHLLAIAVGEGLESGVDFSAAAALANEPVEVAGTGRACVQALPAIGEDFE